MDSSQVSVFEDFQVEQKNKVIVHYQVIITAQAIYLVNSNNNYGGLIKNIFSGVGSMLGLFGGPAGMVGGLATELTGRKLSKVFDRFSKNRSKSELEKVLKNFDKYAADKDGIEKIPFDQLKRVFTKKGYIINGPSYLIFEFGETSFQLFSKERTKIDEVAKTIKNHAPKVAIVPKII